MEAKTEAPKPAEKPKEVRKIKYRPTAIHEDPVETQRKIEEAENRANQKTTILPNGDEVYPDGTIKKQRAKRRSKNDLQG